MQNELSVVKLNENKITELKGQLLENESEKSTLNQRLEDLHNQLTTLQKKGNEVQTLQNKNIFFEKELDIAKMNKRLNRDIVQCEKEKKTGI